MKRNNLILFFIFILFTHTIFANTHELVDTNLNSELYHVQNNYYDNKKQVDLIDPLSDLYLNPASQDEMQTEAQNENRMQNQIQIQTLDLEQNQIHDFYQEQMRSFSSSQKLSPFKIKSKLNSNSRVLLVIAELDTRGKPEYKKLYRGLEELAYGIPSSTLYKSNTYREVHILNNGTATLEKFKNSLYALVNDPKNKIVDVILAVHGRPKRLAFVDKSYSTDEIKKVILADDLGYESLDQKNMLQQKLRLMYNLSCYGSTHIPLFRELGFKTVIGSVAVNANAEIEYPSFLMRWKLGLSVKNSLAWAMTRAVLDAADLPLKWFGIAKNNFLKDINSRKIVDGQSDLNLNSQMD